MISVNLEEVFRIVPFYDTISIFTHNCERILSTMLNTWMFNTAVENTIHNIIIILHKKTSDIGTETEKYLCR